MTHVHAVVVRSSSNATAVHSYESKNNDEMKNTNSNFYWEDGFCVFTEQFLLKRGQCCGNGCRHCPYEPKHNYGSKEVDPKVLQKL
ncbi:MAG: DUF5522 domain-containing protein [Bacteroidia bacterium]